MDRWAGKTAFVTGASAGIGYDLSSRLCELGMNVVGCSRNIEKIEVSDPYPILLYRNYGSKLIISSAHCVAGMARPFTYNSAGIYLVKCNRGRHLFY